MKKKIIKAKDPASAVTHFIGTLMAIFAATPLLIKAAANPGYIHIISLGIFIISMILLYLASTIYHTLNISEKVNRRLRKFDHMMIYLLIAGTYTPICTIALGDTVGISLYHNMDFGYYRYSNNGFFINCPKWISSVIYSYGLDLCLAFTKIINSLPSLPLTGF